MERDSIENITLEVLKQFRSEDGFQPYTVVFNETPLALVAFCTVYVILSFAFILPIGTWRQYKRQKERGFQDEDDDKSSSQEGNELVQLGRSPSVAEIENSGNALSASKDEEAKRLGIRDSIQSVNDEPENGHHGGGGGGAGTRHLSMQGWAGVGISSGEFTLLGAKQIQKEEEEAKVSEDEKLKEGKMRGHGVANGGSSSRVANGGSHSISPDFPHGSLNSRNRSQEQVSVVPSAAPSAATTSWLRNESKRTNRRSSSQASTGSSTVQKSFQSMRLVANKMGLAHQTRTVGRSQAMRRFVQAERLSQAASEEESAAASRSRDPSWTVRSAVRSASHIPRGNASDAASQVLAGEVVEGEADFYRQRFVDHSRRTRQRQLSLSLTSERSFMGALSPDVLAPEDAADANDPGRPNAFYYDPTPIRPRRRVFDPTKGPFARCSMLLDLVEPDYDMLRILKRAFPSIAGSVADPVLRLVLTAIISHFIGTTSMVAFVLVTMFLRLTVEEVAGAIVDTETTMIQMAMSEGGEAAFYLTGQYMQFALFMQILVIIPVLLIWVFLIDDMVIWLLTDTGQDVAVLASEYTKVIVTHYIVIAAGRTIMLPFNMNAPAQFEKVIDVIASICTMVTIGIVATTETNIHEKPTLVIVGWVQVVATITKTIAKISYVVAKGWFQPYQKGFFGSFTLKDPNAIGGFLLTALPLFFGSLIELQEWEILTLFVRALGPGEVTTWATMGVVWEIFVASTSGLGEAGAIRISYYLAENQPKQAKRLSHKVIFLAAIQAFGVGSIFILLGPNIAFVLTPYSVLQNMLSDLVGITALANFSMTFAQIYWALVGAQGRFGLASLCIILSRFIVIYPMAAICVFRYLFDTPSVAGSIAVGYATAAFALALIIMQSDWKQLALEAQEQLMPNDAEAAGLGLGESSDDEEMSDDSDDDEIL